MSTKVTKGSTQRPARKRAPKVEKEPTEQGKLNVSEQESVTVSRPQDGKAKIAIVGYAPSSREKAPYDDKSWDIWGVNELYKIAPRVDVLFELHDKFWLTQKERNPKHLEWLKAAKIPIFMQEHYDDIPASVPYPKADIVNRFGTYFTNSISWMIALAVFVRPDEIGIWGVDMATEIEYQGQRPSVEYFIGWAQGAGIKVHLPAECDLLKSFFLYGYDDREITEMALKMRGRVQELDTRAKQYQANMASNQAAFNQMVGALDDTKYWMRTWVYGDPMKDKQEDT